MVSVHTCVVVDNVVSLGNAVGLLSLLSFFSSSFSCLSPVSLFIVFLLNFAGALLRLEFQVKAVVLQVRSGAVTDTRCIFGCACLQLNRVRR